MTPPGPAWGLTRADLAALASARAVSTSSTVRDTAADTAAVIAAAG